VCSNPASSKRENTSLKKKREKNLHPDSQCEALSISTNHLLEKQRGQHIKLMIQKNARDGSNSGEKESLIKRNITDERILKPGQPVSINELQAQRKKGRKTTPVKRPHQGRTKRNARKKDFGEGGRNKEVHGEGELLGSIQSLGVDVESI